MSQIVGTDLCRVTVVAPRRRMDVSVPSDVPLAQILPTLLRVAGENLADAGLAHSGWVLQRLEEAPLHPSQTLAALGIKDGETLYFRPGMAQFPELAFDDVADVVATGIKDRPDRWRTQDTRTAGLSVTAVGLVLGSLGLALSGPGWLLPGITAGVVALALVTGALTLSRAVGDSWAGAVLGYAALPYGFLAGFCAPAKAGEPMLHFGSPNLMAAFGTTLLIAVIGGFAVADGLSSFLGIAAASLVGLLGAGSAFLWTSLPASGIAAVCAAVVLPLAALVPTLSFRLARLPLPPVPTSADDLRRDTGVLNGATLLKRTAVADRFATGLVGGIALVAIGADAFLAPASGWAAKATTIALSVSLLLRARIFRGRTQRIWMLAAGVTGFGFLLLAQAYTDGQVTVLAAVLAPALIASWVVAGISIWLPTHRMTPFWGRLGDITDVLIVVALFPLAGFTLDIFSTIRGLGG